MYLLNILICTLSERSLSFDKLVNNLKKQIVGKYQDVNILYYCDNREISVGEKRNKLIEKSDSKYICFIDDDDEVCYNYVDLVRTGCLSDADCVSLNGIITFNGHNPKKFVHSIKYDTILPFLNEEGLFTRPPNHLNAIKKELIKDFKFEKVNRDEDRDWAMRVCKSGVLKTEYSVKEVLYFYLYNDKVI